MSIDQAKEWGQAKKLEPFSACKTCRNKYYVVRAGARFAEAVLCPTCMNPCSACQGAGVIMKRGPNGVRAAYPCEKCGVVRARFARFNAAKIPRRFADATIDSFEDPVRNGKTYASPAKANFLAVRNKFHVGDSGIGLSGGVGVGKTHLLCGLVRELSLERATADQIECRFIEFTHLLADIRKGYDEGKGEGEIIGELTTVPVLVIDELGKGLSTAWQMNILDELISRRYNLDVSTFFSTNFPFAEPTISRSSRELTDDFRRGSLVDKIGERMFSRLSEMCEFVTVEGDDRRRVKPAR